MYGFVQRGIVTSHAPGVHRPQRFVREGRGGVYFYESFHRVFSRAARRRLREPTRHRERVAVFRPQGFRRLTLLNGAVKTCFAIGPRPCLTCAGTGAHDSRRETIFELVLVAESRESCFRNGILVLRGA